MSTNSNATEDVPTLGATGLPFDLILMIANQMDDARNVLNLGMTCKECYQVLIGRHWKEVNIAIKGWNFDGSLRPKAKCVAFHNGAVRLTSTWPTHPFKLRPCAALDCQARWLELGLASVDAYLATKIHRFPKTAYLATAVNRFPLSIRELTLDGKLLGEPCPDAVDWKPIHPFISQRGFRDLKPDIVNINLHWSSFCPTLLRTFDPAFLRKLKVPVHRPTDCHKMELAMHLMEKLEALNLIDLPDIDEFIDEYHHLGTGILALRPSLRSLNISMTNFLRPEEFGDKEAFIEPKDSALFFHALFPEPSTQHVAAHVRRIYKEPRTPIQTNLLMSNRGALDLERLQLRNFGLPYWAFQMVFSPKCIKELHLPKCRVDPLVWDHLRSAKAKMLAIIDIRYDQLCKQFFDFITTQTILESLSFARPPDMYHEVERTTDEWVTWFSVLEIAQQAPEYGPGTASGRGYWSTIPWAYPTSLEFTDALHNCRHLKHLVIPIDMWDFSPGFISRLGAGLPALESIEWGFQYIEKDLRRAFVNNFIPHVPHLKKITFTSPYRPTPPRHPYAHYLLFSVFSAGEGGSSLPANLKHIRYRDLADGSPPERFSEHSVYYLLDEPVGENWWLRLDDEEGDRMYEEEATPTVVPLSAIAFDRILYL